MKSQWEFLKKKLKKMNCNGVLLEIDASELDYIDFSSLKNSIDGFPSIMIFKKGKKVKNWESPKPMGWVESTVCPYIWMNQTF